MEKSAPLPHPAAMDVADPGRIKVGSCGRFPAPLPAEIADRRRIRLGGGFRLPVER